MSPINPEVFKIDVTPELNRFHDHLEMIDNNQIIFSGIFGIGKTTFIKEFFETSSDKFETVYISPVNYIVSQNEDIFEYIKYDILFELLGKESVDFQKIEFSKILTAQFFSKDHLFEIITLIVQSSGKISKDLVDLLVPLKELKDKFDTYHEIIQINEQTEAIKYLKSLVEKTGVIYEENRITNLISNLLETIENKQTVLIVDDLDRIDPEHIFRLFNVFGSHLNFCGNNNKFGFSKVIFVCDIENIRNIFHSKFGLNVDFTGYIDKFYSREIFNFDIKVSIENSIKFMVSSINTTGPLRHHMNFKDDSNLKREICIILTKMVYSNAINLRTLIKMFLKNYKFVSYNIGYFLNYFPITNYNIEAVKLFDFLFSLFGNLGNLGIALDKCEKNGAYIKNDNFNGYLPNHFSILDINSHNFKPGDYIYVIDDFNTTIEYNLNISGFGENNIKTKITKIRKTNFDDEMSIPYYYLLRKSFEKYVQFNSNH